MIDVSQDFKIRSLGIPDLDSMFYAFRSAFANYPVRFELSRDDFTKKFVEKLNLDLSFSAGTFFNDKLVGFIFTSISNYEDMRTAYNGGTGVVPEFRGNGLTHKMFEYLLPIFQRNDIKQIVLEVLVNNPAAIKIYQVLGFDHTRNYKCFKLDPMKFHFGKINTEVVIAPTDKAMWSTYCNFFDYHPSYLDSPEMIDKNLRNEIIIEAYFRKKLVGFGIYQPAIGRISQIAVDQSFRNRGIGNSLLRHIYNTSRNKLLTIINVDENSKAFLSFLIKAGFNEELEQHEMRMTI